MCFSLCLGAQSYDDDCENPVAVMTSSKDRKAWVVRASAGDGGGSCESVRPLAKAVGNISFPPQSVQLLSIAHAFRGESAAPTMHISTHSSPPVVPGRRGVQRNSHQKTRP